MIRECRDGALDQATTALSAFQNLYLATHTVFGQKMEVLRHELRTAVPCVEYLTGMQSDAFS